METDLAKPVPVDVVEVAKACHFEMRQRGCLDDQAERLGDPLAIITRHIAVAIAERDRLQVAVEEARQVMPVPNTQGVQFGNSWVSFDKLCGWDGDDPVARESFYERSIIAKGIVAWANGVRAWLARNAKEAP